MVVIGVVVKMYLWWSLCTLYLRARQMRVTISNSGLCCRICVTFFKRRVLYEVVYSTGPVRPVDNMQYIYIQKLSITVELWLTAHQMLFYDTQVTCTLSRSCGRACISIKVGTWFTAHISMLFYDTQVACTLSRSCGCACISIIIK